MSSLLLVIDTGLSCGGAGRVASVLMKYWIEDGRKIELVSLYGKERDFFRQPDEVKRIVVGWNEAPASKLEKFLFHIKYLYRLRKTIQSSNSKVVVSFLSTANVRSLIASAGLGVRVVLSERSDFSQQKLSSRWGYLSKWIYRYADMVTANSRKTIDSLKNFVPHNKLALVPNPVEIPNKFARPADSVYILNVGRLIPLKAQALILEAFAKVHEDYQQWVVQIVGDGPEKENLQNRARYFGIVGSLQLIGTVESPADYYRRAGIFVMPSEYEGMPNVLLEAMAYGLPCVVSDSLDGALEHIEHNVTGLVFRNGDAIDLKNKLVMLLESPELRTKLGQSARLSMSQYTPQYVVQSWDQALFPGS